MCAALTVRDEASAVPISPSSVGKAREERKHITRAPSPFYPVQGKQWQERPLGEEEECGVRYTVWP